VCVGVCVFVCVYVCACVCRCASQCVAVWSSVLQCGKGDLALWKKDLVKWGPSRLGRLQLIRHSMDNCVSCGKAIFLWGLLH